MYADESLGFDLDGTVYALDSTTIDLCLSVFPWARFQPTKGAVKMHTLLDVRGPIPTFIEVSDGKLHDVNIILDEIQPEVGLPYVVDRCCRTSSVSTPSSLRRLLCRTHQSRRPVAKALLVAVDKTTGLRSDHTVMLTSAALLRIIRTRFAASASL